MRTFAVSTVLDFGTSLTLHVSQGSPGVFHRLGNLHGLLGYAPLAWTLEMPNKAKASHTLCVCLGLPFLLKHLALSSLMTVPLCGKEQMA